METMRLSHLYEQLPLTHYEGGKYEYPKSDYGSPSPQLLPLDALSLSEDGSLASGGAARSFRPHLLSSQFSVQSQNCQTPAHRKRENPLYQSISQIDVKSSKSQYPHNFLFALSLVLTLFACLVSFVSIGIAVHLNKAVNHAYVEGLEAEMKNVLLKYDLIAQQIIEMKQAENESLKTRYELITNLSLVIQREIEIYQKFDSLQIDVDQQILNISKMPGPPGPPGLANIQACKHSFQSAGGASAQSETFTAWIPANITEAKKNVLTGVDCSTDTGSAAFLNTTKINGFTQFRCRCFGIDYRSATSRFCTIHFWSCPVDN